MLTHRFPLVRHEEHMAHKHQQLLEQQQKSLNTRSFAEMTQKSFFIGRSLAPCSDPQPAMGSQALFLPANAFFQKKVDPQKLHFFRHLSLSCKYLGDKRRIKRWPWGLAHCPISLLSLRRKATTTINLFELPGPKNHLQITWEQAPKALTFSTLAKWTQAEIN